MPQAIVIHQTGGPDVLRLEDIKTPAPGKGQILVKHSAVGINYIDVYHRSGLYPLPKMPAILGMEAAGHIVAVGKDVEGFKEGDRIAYGTGPVGAYRAERVISADIAVKLPDNISDEVAAAVMVKGLTAHYLTRRTYIVTPGITVLIHAAAGGVGLLAGQWAKDMGATVIGTVGSDEKAALIKQYGYDYAINYKTENFVERVREITKGEGVPVVYDSVGRDTFEGSINCLHTFGTLVSYGQSSGPVPPVNLSTLSKKSLFLTRPTLQDYKRNRMELVFSAQELFEMIDNKKLKVKMGKKYKLEDAVQAHKDLEGRKTVGCNVFIVGK